MEYVISEDVAQSQLDAMEEEFGPLDPANAEAVFRAIRAGLLEFDESEGSITYMLQKPPETQSSLDLSSVTFREPGAKEMEKINKGLTVKTDRNGNAEFDASAGVAQAIRLMVHVGGWPLAAAEKVKRRDMQVLQALIGFFG